MGGYLSTVPSAKPYPSTQLTNRKPPNKDAVPRHIFENIMTFASQAASPDRHGRCQVEAAVAATPETPETPPETPETPNNYNELFDMFIDSGECL